MSRRGDGPRPAAAPRIMTRPSYPSHERLTQSPAPRYRDHTHHGRERNRPTLGGRRREAVSPRRRRLVRRLRRRARASDPGGGPRRGAPAPRPAEAAGLLPPPERPERRRPHRAPHLHLLPRQGRRRPHQQLDGAGRGLRPAREGPRRLHGRADDVRHSVPHGPAGLAVQPGRRPGDRQPLRRPQHADHDAHGHGSPSITWATRTTSRGACTRTADLDVERRFICHFPDDHTIWSVGSGYGGNALLGKKCLALRIASDVGRREGWLAEHMLIVGIESPDGEITYVCGAFPSACGKTNLAMLMPPALDEGLEDPHRRRRHRVAPARRGRAAVGDQPRERVLRRGARHQLPHQPERHGNDPARHHLHQRRAPPRRHGVVGGPRRPGARVRQPTGRAAPGRPESTEPAAHPNSRFTAPADAAARRSRRTWQDPEGVPISAILFGARRRTLVPLVFQAFNWQHGTFLGATIASETTAAATGAVGVVRRDPMAMLPFCGYNMADYWGHWLEMGKRLSRPPKMFRVNWFRRDAEGRSSGRASATTCGCSSGSSSAAAMAARSRRRRSATALPPAPFPRAGSISRPGPCRSCSTSTARPGRRTTEARRSSSRRHPQHHTHQYKLLHKALATVTAKPKSTTSSLFTSLITP